MSDDRDAQDFAPAGEDFGQELDDGFDADALAVGQVTVAASVSRAAVYGQSAAAAMMRMASARSGGWDPKYGPRVGEASFYGTSRRGDPSGDGFAGRDMANQKPMNPRAFTAAHRKLPLGSWVIVTRVGSYASVIVQITDRGPYHGNRILDLSVAAAEHIGMIEAGHAEVSLSILSLGARRKPARIA